MKIETEKHVFGVPAHVYFQESFRPLLMQFSQKGLISANWKYGKSCTNWADTILHHIASTHTKFFTKMTQSYGNALKAPQSNIMKFDSTFHRGFNMLYRQEHFPFKLYRLLEEAHKHGLTHVISWSADGLSFSIYQPKVFANTLMKLFFSHTKYKR